MRIEHLKYLIEIDKRHSISAAARELYLGQTSLSAIVKSLEDDLGFHIFHRAHNGVQTTPEGEEALALIWEISERFEEIKQLSSHGSTLSQPIPIITSPTINSAMALPLNAAFLEEAPYGNLDFIVVPGEEVGQKIIKNDGNLGVTYFKKDDLESFRLIASRYQVNVDVLMQDCLHLLVSKDHPLSALDSISPEALTQQHFAMLSHYSSCDSSVVYTETFGSNNRYTTFSNIGLIKHAVLNQNMIAILSGYAIHHNHSIDNSHTKVITLTDTHVENELHLALIHRADCNLTYQEKVLLQCIKEHFKQISL